MASLPSNTFICNYNARDYIASTNTFPKTEGQTLDRNIVLEGTPTAYTEDGYVHFNGGQYMSMYFNSVSNNPFNRYNNDTGRSLTIVYKTSSFSYNLLANRGTSGSSANGDHYNYMVRENVFHTSDSSFLRMTASTSPYIMYVRIGADGTSERKCVTTGQIVTASSVTYGNTPNSVGFFRGFGGGSLGETYVGDFYWIYVSTETLTDDEINQVIRYNEGISFDLDTTAITASYNSTTSSVTLTTEEDIAWSATTIPSWVSLSTTGGTGSATITVTLSKNIAYAQRTGSIIFTSSEGDTAEIVCTQAKHPILIPQDMYRSGDQIEKLYRTGSTINKMYRSGELIYLRLNPPTE